MRKKFLASFRVVMALALSVLATNGLAVPSVFADSLNGNGPNNTSQVSTPVSTTVQWDGQHGADLADPQCEDGQTANWHWILTPGGGSTLLSGTLSVDYSTGNSQSLTGFFPGNGNGAMQFNGTDAAPSSVTGASVDFTYEPGNGNANFVLTISDSSCTGTPTPPTDVCANIDGVQTEVPEGMVVDNEGNCTTPPTDVCKNIEGVQTEVPEGMTVDNQGNCTEEETNCPDSPYIVQQGNNCKIMICHATAAVKNPYVSLTVDISAADGDQGNDNGQGDHFAEHTGPIFNALVNHNGDNWGDIIPPIPGVHDGLNWTAQGQAILDNDCVPTPVEATPAAVTFTNPTCENLGSFTVPTTNGVTYMMNGATVAAGTHTVANGTSVTITAVANDGFVLTGTTSFSHTFTAPTNCVLGETDVCPNLTGTQTTVPSGMVKDNSGNCVTPVGGLGGGEVLGVTTTAPVLANTGTNDFLANVLIGLSLIGLAVGLRFAVPRRQYR